MSVLTNIAPDGKVLYAIALENYKTGFSGFIYYHAHNIGEVFRHILDGGLNLRKDTRVAWIAPAVGVLAELDEKDNVKELTV
jgi:hypothetical protein